jgi:hypothetical protein
MKFILLIILAVPFMANARMFPKGKEPKWRIHPAMATGITQADFNALLDKMQATFEPIYAAKGEHLQINRLWSDSTINSDAHWQGNVCIINAYGGLARVPGMTPDGYLMVNGHENGHCIGQPPLYPGDNMSDEGQADTYAVDAAHLAGLSDARIEAAAQVLADVLAMLGGERQTGWPGPVLPAVRVTFHDHSDGQCRRDSMMFRLLAAPRPNCWYANGAPTGVIPGGKPPAPQPGPAPMPAPGPRPPPVPKPPPAPAPCNCCAVIQQLVHELKAMQAKH